MTRKCLVKCLMGLKVSRNEANRLAARYRSIGMPYIMGYADFLFGFNSASVGEHWRQICQIRAELEAQTGETCRTFRETADVMLRVAKEEKKHEFCN